MPDDVVIKVENLSKQYRIGGAQAGYRTFRETLVDAAKAPLYRISSVFRPASYVGAPAAERIWALRDVTFEVKQGDVVGIIGKNGAGKTTLLKILSRITEPTGGRATLRGRVGSLLEVGTGFHPELTGHENVYMYGAILGMNRREVSRKFDEIADFAELAKFVETPVKRYSSGMYMRLAFAVAAHMDTEILLVDEVLAVGDAAFQRKCIGKMGDVSREGRSVLFVSHNLEAIRRLCGRVILLNRGSVLMDDSGDNTITEYLSLGREGTGAEKKYGATSGPGDDYARLESVRISNRMGSSKNLYNINESINVEVGFAIRQPISNFHILVRVFAQDGTLLFGSGDWDEELESSRRLAPGRYCARCAVPGDLLNRGLYGLTVIGIVPDVRVVFEAENVLEWEVSEVGGAGGAASSQRPGILRPRLRWRLTKVPEERQV